MESPEVQAHIGKKVLDFLDRTEDMKYWDKNLESMHEKELGQNFRIALTGKTPEETKEREYLLMLAIDKVIEHFVVKKKDSTFTYTRQNIRSMIEGLMTSSEAPGVGGKKVGGKESELPADVKEAFERQRAYTEIYSKMQAELIVRNPEGTGFNPEAMRLAIEKKITSGQIFSDQLQLRAFVDVIKEENFGTLIGDKEAPNRYLVRISEDPRFLSILASMRLGIFYNLLKALPNEESRSKLINRISETRAKLKMDNETSVSAFFGMFSRPSDRRIIFDLARQDGFKFETQGPFHQALESAPELAKEIIDSFAKELIGRDLDAFAAAMHYSKPEDRLILIKENEANVKTKYQYFASVLSYIDDPKERDRIIFEVAPGLVYSNGFAFANAYRFCSDARKPELLNDAKAKALFEKELSAEFGDMKMDNKAYLNISFLSNFLAKLPGYGPEFQIKTAMEWLENNKSSHQMKQKAVLLLLSNGQKIDKLSPQQLEFSAKTLLDTGRTRTDVSALARNPVYANLAIQRNYGMASYFSSLIALEQQAYGKPYWQKYRLYEQILSKRDAMKDQPLILGTTFVSFAHERGSNPETMSSASDSFSGEAIRNLAQRSNVAVSEMRMSENCSSTSQMLQELEKTRGPVTLHLAGHGMKGYISLGIANKPETMIDMKDLFEVMAKDPGKVRQIIFDSCYSDQNAKILLNLWRTDSRTVGVTPPIMLTSSNDDAPSLTAPMDGWMYFAATSSPDKVPTWGDYWDELEGRSMALAWKGRYISDPAISVPESPGSTRSLIIG